MSSYLLDVMCDSREYPSLGWKWKSDLPSIHVYCKMLWENKYKEDYELICNGLSVTIYQILFGEEAPCLSPKGQRIVKEYGDWYMTSDGVYIRISSRTKPQHWLPHVVPNTLFLQDISIKHMWMVYLFLFIETRRVFGLCFLYRQKFVKFEILDKPKISLVF